MEEKELASGHQAHLSLWPAPEYMENAKGRKEYKEMQHQMKQKRIASTLDVEDVSNRRGMRAKGGY